MCKLVPNTAYQMKRASQLDVDGAERLWQERALKQLQ